MKRDQVQVLSENDLEKEFQNVSGILSSTEPDWKQRINALKKVQTIITSGGTAFKNFLKQFLKFVSPLSVQLSDLRSAVCKEAANTAIIAAEACGDSFELCAERLSDTLFRLLNSGTKVIAETGHQCLLKIIDSVTTSRLVPKTVEQFKSKNPNIRVKSSLYLAIMLENYPFHVFQNATGFRGNFAEMLERGIKSAVHDAAKEARANGRRAFLAYRALFPDEATRLYSTFDYSVQKAFGEEPSAPPRRPSSTKPNSRQQNPQKAKTESGFYSSHSSSMKKTTKGIRSESPPAKLEGDLSCTGGSEEIRAPPVKSKKPVIEKPPSENPETRLSLMLDKSYSENWSTRFNCFDKLSKKLIEEDGECYAEAISNSEQLFEKLINTHIEHLRDSHFKVVTACLESSKVIIEMFPEKASFFLESLLPKLLDCFGDSKEGVSQAADDLLEIIIDIYIPEDLLTLLMRFQINEAKPKSKLKFLEFLTRLADLSEDYFESQLQVKSFVKKVANLAKDSSSKPLLSQAVKALEGAKQKNQDLTLSSIVELPSREQEVVRKLAQEFGSDLSYHLKPRTVHLQEETKKPQEVTRRPQEASRRPLEETKNPQELARKPLQENNLLATLVSQASGSGAVKYDALKKVQGLLESSSPLWESNFEDFLKICTDSLQDPALSIRDCCLQVLKELGRRHPAKVSQQLSPILEAITEGFNFEERHMYQATEESMEALLAQQSPRKVIPELVKLINQNDVPVLQALIRQLTEVIKNSSGSVVVEFMRGIMDQMKHCFNHSNADVRKSVVFCLVEIQAVIGSDFDIFLEELSPSQQKLVTIYIQRRMIA